jgi:hypothetical protein
MARFVAMLATIKAERVSSIPTRANSQYNGIATAIAGTIFAERNTKRREEPLRMNPRLMPKATGKARPTVSTEQQEAIISEFLSGSCRSRSARADLKFSTVGVKTHTGGEANASALVLKLASTIQSIGAR